MGGVSTNTEEGHGSARCSALELRVCARCIACEGSRWLRASSPSSKCPYERVCDGDKYYSISWSFYYLNPRWCSRKTQGPVGPTPCPKCRLPTE